MRWFLAVKAIKFALFICPKKDRFYLADKLLLAFTYLSESGIYDD